MRLKESHIKGDWSDRDRRQDLCSIESNRNRGTCGALSKSREGVGARETGTSTQPYTVT